MHRSTPTILALGGGRPDNRILARFIVSLADVSAPRVCYIGTAGGDPPDAYRTFAENYSGLGCQPVELSLFRQPEEPLEALVMRQNIIYVGGGNTRNMLALWRLWGLDVILRRAWESGVVLCGSSAGSICWFQQGTTDSWPGRISPLDCLGFLPGSNCPHYHSEPLRRPTYLKMVAEGQLPPGLATDDTVGLLFRGDELERVVSASPDAGAWRVEACAGGVTETPLACRMLAES
ncbi:MAG: peptidase E [Armatimonadetes bacterium]|nr:peptidase E [Armatimonadota bacterium]MDE2207447.1 peptidase E [Armatimonadota bacterium]